MLELTKSEKDRDLTVIADALAAMDQSKLESEASVKLLTRLKDEVYPVAAEVYYDKGHNLYRDAKYEEAVIDLEKAMKYDPTDEDAVYYLARSYHRLDDLENAAVYYSIVVKDFADSDRKDDAEGYLEQIQE
jgi:Flp pilus assembly protein TadD